MLGALKKIRENPKKLKVKAMPANCIYPGWDPFTQFFPGLARKKLN